MAAKAGHIDFMFLGPPPLYPTAGSASGLNVSHQSLLDFFNIGVSAACFFGGGRDSVYWKYK